MNFQQQAPQYPAMHPLLSDVPSPFVQNLISKMYIEGLDPPRPKLQKTKASKKGWMNFLPGNLPSHLPPTPPSHLPHVPPYHLPPTPPSHLPPLSPMPALANGVSPTLDELTSNGELNHIQSQQQIVPAEIPDLNNIQMKLSDQKSFRRVKNFNRDELQGPRMYSDDLIDSCKHRCQVCQKDIGITAMRCHTKLAHGLSISLYQAKHGNIKDNMSHVVWHKCKLCTEEFLLDSDEIHRHATAKHGISLKEYNSRYTTPVWKRKRKSPTPPAPLTPPPSEPQLKREKTDYGFLDGA